MAKPSVENRKQIRLRVKFDVLINNAIKADVLDLSEGGMFIHTSIPFPQGKVIELVFTPYRGSPEVTVKASVQYVHAGLAIGVAFIDLPDSVRQGLRSFIDANIDKSRVAAEGIGMDTRKKVLIADESAATRTMVKNKLMLGGLAVRETSNGVDAIKAVGEDVPDVIIFDAMMKGMDAEKFLHMIRSKDAWKGIKIVLLSGSINAEQISKLSVFGVSAILPKMTTTPKKLAEKISEILDKG